MISKNAVINKKNKIKHQYLLKINQQLKKDKFDLENKQLMSQRIEKFNKNHKKIKFKNLPLFKRDYNKYSLKYL